MRTKTVPPKVSRRRLSGARIAIVRAEFNREITESLEQACLGTLVDAGLSADQVDCFTVPGCFEIPLFAQRLARKRRYDVLIALGAVIRGDTYHFELVANECARGIMDVSLRHDLPIVFEVLAVYRRRDAERRAGQNALNKGIEAAGAALAWINSSP